MALRKIGLVMSIPTLTHIAGPFENYMQKCARCGEILLDLSGEFDSDGPGPTKGFTEGRSIVKGSDVPWPPYSSSTLGEPPPMCEFRRKVPA